MRIPARVTRRIRQRWPRRGPRRASFPFISGDTYRSLCADLIESPQGLTEFLRRDRPDPGGLVFCEVEYLSPLLERIDEARASRLELIVHNGDLLPVELLEANYQRLRRVCAVNWLGDPRHVEPLPIGLENSWLNVNGRLELFEDCVPHRRRELLVQARPDDVLVAFNDLTSPSVRAAARQAFLASGLGVVGAEARLDPVEYHRLLRRVKFVASPRGNGPDCHRTWEAIYAGAVPVVLRDHWGFSHLDLPVLVAESWADAVRAIEAEPQRLYEQITQGASAGAFAIDFLGRLSRP